MAEKYSKLSIPLLKGQLKDRGLEVSGKKSDLIQRLVDSDSTVDDAADAAPSVDIDENGHDEASGDEDAEMVDEEGVSASDGLIELDGGGGDDGAGGDEVEEVVEHDEKTTGGDVIDLAVDDEQNDADVVKEEGKGGKAVMQLEVKQPSIADDSEADCLIILDETKADDATTSKKEGDVKESKKDDEFSYEAMIKRLDKMYFTNNKKARYIDNQMKTIKIFGMKSNHVIDEGLEKLFLVGRWYVFSKFKDEKGRNTGMVEVNFSTCERAAEVAMAVRDFEVTLTDGEKERPFSVETYYGDFEEVLQEREKKRAEDRKKREEEEKRRKEREEERKIMAEREKEMAKFRAALDARSLYVGNLPKTASTEMVKNMFTEAMRVEIQSNDDGTCKGHCYIEFTDEKVRDDCVEKYKGAKIDEGEETFELVIKKMPLVSELPKEEEPPKRESKPNRSRSRSTDRSRDYGGEKRWRGDRDKLRDFDRDRSRKFDGRPRSMGSRFDRERPAGGFNSRFGPPNRRSFEGDGEGRSYDSRGGGGRSFGGPGRGRTYDGRGGRGGMGGRRAILDSPMHGEGHMGMGEMGQGWGGGNALSMSTMPSGMMASMLQMQRQLAMQGQQMQPTSLLGDAPIPSLSSLNMPDPSSMAGRGPASGFGGGHRMSGRPSRFSM